MNFFKTCCICHKIIQPSRDENGIIYHDGTNNPNPISDEPDHVCCDNCNRTIVLPTRIGDAEIYLQERKQNES